MIVHGPYTAHRGVTWPRVIYLARAFWIAVLSLVSQAHAILERNRASFWSVRRRRAVASSAPAVGMVRAHFPRL